MFAEQTGTTIIQLDSVETSMTVRVTVRFAIPGDWPRSLRIAQLFEPLLPWQLHEPFIMQPIGDAGIESFMMAYLPRPEGGVDIQVTSLDIDPPLADDIDPDQARVMGRVLNGIIKGMIASMALGLYALAPWEPWDDETPDAHMDVGQVAEG